MDVTGTKVLVAVASRHGATFEIADHVARGLRDAGHEVSVLDVTHGHHGEEAVAGFDAFVIGSAIYEGQWIRGARHFVLENAIALQAARVWFFSSGPVGDDEHIAIDSHRVDELKHAVDAIEHRVFSGRLVRSELGRIERWIVDVVRAHEGDYRDWSAIESWATGIAHALDADRASGSA